MPRRFRTLAASLVTLIVVAACSNGVPLGPSDAATGSKATPTAPAPTTPVTPTPTAPVTGTVTTAVAYTQDLQAIFNSDCVPCHGSRSTAGRYNMTTYVGVMAAVRAGSASSALVIVTQPGGLMYTFLSGDRAGKAAMIRTWVMNGAPQSR